MFQKISLILLALFLYTASFGQVKPTLFVAAKSGLKLRETASLTGKPLLTAPQGASVVWISTDYQKSVEVEGTQGYMAKVKFNGKTGYMFDGYLSNNSPLAPLVIKKPVVIIKDTDEMQLAEMKGTANSADLAEAGSDIGFYQMAATDELKKHKIPFTNTNLRFIQFVKADGTTELIDTKTAEMNDCFLFNGKIVKPSHIIDFSTTEAGKIPEPIQFMKSSRK
jgi:hypothetical protein